MPSRIQLKQIWKNVICAKKDAEPKFILKKNNVIQRFKQQLWLLPKFSDLSEICLIWDWTKKIKLPDNLGVLVVDYNEKSFRLPFFNEKVTIRFGLHGKVKIINQKNSKKSKKIWQELSIAPWLRKRIPLVYYNNNLITAVGVFITESGRCIKEQSGIKIKWIVE